MKWIASTLLGALSILIAAISGPSAYDDWTRKERGREAKEGLGVLFFHMKSELGYY